MIPLIVHNTAKTKDITWEERQLLHRAHKMFPGWAFRFWDDEDNANLVREHFPAHFDCYQSIRRGVIKADIARCMYMHAYGGIYADTDYKWIRRVPEDLLNRKCVFTVSGGSPENANGPDFRVCNSVLISEKGHPFWADFLDNIFTHGDLANTPEHMIEKVTGPEGMTSFYQSRASHYPDIFLADRCVFQPPIRLFGFSYAGTQETLGIHYCWGRWRTKSPILSARNFVTRKTTPFLGGFTGTAPGR